jgi:uncharacterized membrane protein YbhN (UPF0104 family)
MASEAERGRAGGEGASAETVLAAQSRSLRNSIIGLAVFFALVVALLLAVPGLRNAAELITDADGAWVCAAVVLELLSCVGYVVLFGLVFGKLVGRLSSRLSLAELAVNSVVSVSGLAGIALGAWVLRTRGVSPERIGRRSVLVFVLTSAVNVFATIAIGLAMWLGLLPGSRNALLTLLPAAVALVVLVLVLAGAAHLRRGVATGRFGDGRAAVAASAVGWGVGEGTDMIRARDWRLSGAVGYWLFDNLALYACLEAFGHTLSFWAVAMAYLVGMLANSLPVPGGLVAVEGGLVGMLLLFGARPASMVLAAVVVYRAISLWLPALIGTAAFFSLRRELAKPAAAVPG